MPTQSRSRKPPKPQAPPGAFCLFTVRLRFVPAARIATGEISAAHFLMPRFIRTSSCTHSTSQASRRKRHASIRAALRAQQINMKWRAERDRDPRVDAVKSSGADLPAPIGFEGPRACPPEHGAFSCRSSAATDRNFSGNVFSPPARRAGRARVHAKPKRVGSGVAGRRLPMPRPSSLRPRPHAVDRTWYTCGRP